MLRSCVGIGSLNPSMMGKKDLTFHKFPDREKKHEKWKRWIQAQKHVNADESAWVPGGKYIYTRNREGVIYQYIDQLNSLSSINCSEQM